MRDFSQKKENFTPEKMVSSYYLIAREKSLGKSSSAKHSADLLGHKGFVCTSAPLFQRFRGIGDTHTNNTLVSKKICAVFRAGGLAKAFLSSYQVIGRNHLLQSDD
jgi:hypothetical protein